MESDKLNQLRKTIGNAAKVMRVFEILTAVFTVLILAIVIISSIYDAAHLNLNISFFGRKIASGTGNVLMTILFAVFTCVIFGLVFSLFRYLEKSFRNMEKEESPFNKENYHGMKAASILVTILVVAQSNILLGLITGVAFYSFLKFFAYGCELQKLSDETL